MATASRMKVIRYGEWRVDALVRLPGLKLDHCSPIREALDWGPQDSDFETQEKLRCTYYRSKWFTDFDAYIEALESGDEVLFWWWARNRSPWPESIMCSAGGFGAGQLIQELSPGERKRPVGGNCHLR